MISIFFHSIRYLFFAILIFLAWRAWRTRRRVWIVLSVIAWGATILGIYQGIATPTVNEIKISYAKLPDELNGYRIVQISDIHINALARRWRTEAIVERVNALKPDLICVTGDLVDGKAEKRRAAIEPLRNLRAKDGVYYVAGNHEFYGERAKWRKIYEEWGMKFLANECVFPRSSLALGGVNDIVAHRCGEAMPCIEETFLAATNNEFRILLEHRPINARENIKRYDIDLQLSGHTHGGIVPVFDLLVAKLNAGFVKGLYQIGDGYLYVSPGSGQWDGFPIRLFNASEITVITLSTLD